MEVKSITLKNKDGIALAKGDEILLERVGRIIMTGSFERVNNPLFGSLTHTYLFNLPNILHQNFESHIRQRIEFYEPSVSVSSVDIRVEKEVATININMTKKEDFQPLTFEASIVV